MKEDIYVGVGIYMWVATRGVTYDDASKRRALRDHERLLSFLAEGGHVLGVRHLVRCENNEMLGQKVSCGNSRRRPHPLHTTTGDVWL